MLCANLNANKRAHTCINMCATLSHTLTLTHARTHAHAEMQYTHTSVLVHTRSRGSNLWKYFFRGFARRGPGLSFVGTAMYVYMRCACVCVYACVALFPIWVHFLAELYTCSIQADRQPGRHIKHKLYLALPGVPFSNMPSARASSSEKSLSLSTYDTKHIHQRTHLQISKGVPRQYIVVQVLHNTHCCHKFPQYIPLKRASVRATGCHHQNHLSLPFHVEGWLVCPPSQCVCLSVCVCVPLTAVNSPTVKSTHKPSEDHKKKA